MLARLGIFVVFFFALANAYTAGQCSGDCEALDPFVIQRKADDKYFRFSTASGISITTADNLTGPWKHAGTVLPDGSTIKMPNTDSKQIWCPDVQYVDDLYYLYYSMSTNGTPDSAMGVASSSTMEEGSWKDHGEIGINSNKDSDYNAIDPNLITIDKQSYVTFGSYQNGLHQVKMQDPLRKDPKSEPYQVAYNSTANHRQEGPNVFHHGDHYFLFISVGLNEYPDNKRLPPGDEYRIIVCRSESGTGDYVDRHGTLCTKNGGDTLISSDGNVYGPGGQGVFNDTSLGPIIYYHYANTDISMERTKFQFGWNRLCFTKSNWPVVCDSDDDTTASGSASASSQASSTALTLSSESIPDSSSTSTSN